MNAAILCWGSLYWEPKNLKVFKPWKLTELHLPIEFSRISGGDRLTLVVDFDNGVEIPVYAAESSITNFKEAQQNLKNRERTAPGHIGFYDSLSMTRSKSDFDDKSFDCRNHSKVAQRVEAWLESVDYDAVIWTALPSNFSSAAGKVFSVENAVDYISNLSGTKRQEAIEYIVRAPKEVDTPVRTALEKSGILDLPGA